MILLFFAIVHVFCVIIKIRHAYKKGHDFGYGLILGLMKKNLSPCLVEDLLESRKLNTHIH